MGRLIYHQQYGLLELDDFLLQHGDQVEILILGSWVSGIIAHDQNGWFFLTREKVGIRLRTGLAAHLLSLASDTPASTKGA